MNRINLLIYYKKKEEKKTFDILATICALLLSDSQYSLSKRIIYLRLDTWVYFTHAIIVIVVRTRIKVFRWIELIY